MSMVLARAKLTLSLKIVGVRPSDGYHLIDAHMVTLELADRLHIAEGDSLTVSGPFAEGVPTDERNLVRKALAAVGRVAQIHIDKQIPAGGGLGGGSADAAAVLRWAECRDLAVATRLGADVPFCLTGGQARVTGIGDAISPLEWEPRRFTLCVPPLAVSTIEVYRAWDAMGGPVSDGPNDLEAAAIAVEPQLARWRDRFAEATGQVPVLAGSGGTWFVNGDAAAPEVLEALTGATVIATGAART
ncbi:MAG: ispE [Acidimicrobiia bacterium]|nr:ispE [Acidimicrobiia bacterium]